MRKQAHSANEWPDPDNLLRETVGDRMIRVTQSSARLQDTADLDTLLAEGWVVAARVAAPQSDGTPGFAAQITLRRAHEHALMMFTDTAQIPCFTHDTAILTRTGPKPVQDLQQGDFVSTRDNGLQAVRWIGRRNLDAQMLEARPHWSPVLIRTGALGPGYPARDMRVSPNHRMLVTAARTDSGTPEELLVAARHLTCLPGVSGEPGTQAAYFHILFDRHEVIMANGCWSESYQPDAESLLGLERKDRRALLTLCPELAHQPRLPEYMPARPFLGRREAAQILRGMTA